MCNSSLSRFSHPEDHMFPIREYPYVLISALYVNFCLVNVNKRTFENVLNQNLLGRSIVLGKGPHEV